FLLLSTSHPRSRPHLHLTSPPSPYTTLFRSCGPPRRVLQPARHRPDRDEGPHRRRHPPLPGGPLQHLAADHPGGLGLPGRPRNRSEEHTSELQSRFDLVCRLLLEKKKKTTSY